jgi:hypothetical protein
MIYSWGAVVAFSLLWLGPKSHSFVSATINEVTTFAGGGSGSANGIGTTAQFQFPQGVSLSSDGLYAFVADNRVGGELDKVGLLEEEEEEEEEGTVSLGCKVKIFSTTRPG